MRNQRVLLQAIIALLVVVPGLLLQPRRMVHAAHGVRDATFSVTTCSDSGSGSLRQAINDANANSGGTITFNIGAPCTITLTAATGGTLVISKNVTLDASGSPEPVIISGNNQMQVFQVNSGGTLTLNTLSIVDGLATNDGGNGGGIFNAGTVIISNSTIAKNSSGGGGVGGGIFNTGTVSISNSTIANNSANVYGGGIFNKSGTVSISNSTIANNTASVAGGGIFNDLGGTVTVAQSIVAKNTVTSRGNNCFGTLTDRGYNLESGTDCGFTANTDVQNTDPNLASALADNGGSTQTLALRDGSPAINKIPTNVCTIPTDQRGVSRPQGLACDMGAFEFRVPILHLPSSPITVPATSSQGATVTYTVTASLPDDPSSSPTVSCSPASGSTFPIGTTTVTCTANDQANPPDVTTGGLQVIVQSSASVVVIGPVSITASSVGTLHSETPGGSQGRHHRRSGRALRRE